jgi:p-hydroxybenzoate 3-monooxygenase
MSNGKGNHVVTRTRVGIIGAGPAGLLIGNLLLQAGIDCIIVEHQSREYVEHRTRAGMIEHWVGDFLRSHGLADRLLREGMTHPAVSSGMINGASASSIPHCTEIVHTTSIHSRSW